MGQLQQNWRLGVLTLLGAIALIADCAKAQVIPDQTLGTENSTVRNEQIPGRDGLVRDSELIEGGARRGGNLFHSFGQFDVQEGQGAYFANPEGVSNILGRVTGGDRSEIFGTLGVLGSANLFLMNPNGIVFGSNASLDIQGSFVGTTANAVQFGDQSFFSADGSEIPQQLLTVNPSAFLFNSPSIATNSITVQGNGQGIRLTTTPVDIQVGLRVPGNQTLALIGGNLIFEGATIKTDGGRIELGSVASGSVGLMPVEDGWTFNYANIPAFQDIQLTQRTVIDASGLGGGNIQVRGNRITLSGESQIEASTLGSQPGGNLEVTATDALNLNGLQTDDYYPAIVAQTYSAGTGGNIYIKADNISFNGLGAIFAQVTSTGKGGNIYVRSDNISLNGQVRISTTTFGAGQGGDIAIQADRGVDIDGTGVSARIETDVDGEAGAQGGNLIITTPQLNVRSAQISSSVRSGNGQGGNLTVRASESVDLSGETPRSAGASPGGLIVQVNTNAAGQGGDLCIETGRLSISNGSQAQAASFGNGDSGNIFISANRVEVLGTNTQNFDTGIIVGTGRDSRSTELPRGNSGDLTIKADQISVQGGGKISGNTEGAGNAGTILPQATDSIVLSGENLTNRNGNGSPGGVFAQVELGATGQGGNLRIETGRLSISDGSKVQVGTFS